MRITLTSVSVADQEKALIFYTETLGFIKKTDFPVGDARWLTVVSPEAPEGPELVLEPNAGYPPMKQLKEALWRDGIPYTMFAVSDIHAAYERLQKRGVAFSQPPTTQGDEMTAIFDDTCGNLIMLYQDVDAKGTASVRIIVSSIPVSNQAHALAFYTEKLGFIKKADVPVGDARWLTVVSLEDPDGMELVLEPNAEYPAMKQLKEALRRDGIPYTMLAVSDMHAEYERLQEIGVVFSQPPTEQGGVMTAILDDTCGNLILLHQSA